MPQSWSDNIVSKEHSPEDFSPEEQRPKDDSPEGRHAEAVDGQAEVVEPVTRGYRT